MRSLLEQHVDQCALELLKQFNLEDIETRHIRTAQRLKGILFSLGIPDILTTVKKKFYRLYQNSSFEESVFPKHGFIPVTNGTHHEVKDYKEIPPDNPIGYYMCQVIPFSVELSEFGQIDSIKKIGVWVIVPRPLTKPKTTLIRAGDFNGKPVFSRVYVPSDRMELQEAIAQSLLTYKPSFRNK